MSYSVLALAAAVSAWASAAASAWTGGYKEKLANEFKTALPKLELKEC
jgi:hypothetical protein